MSLGIDCLLAESDDQARRLAQQLDDLNRERRALQASMEVDAGVHLQAARQSVEQAAERGRRMAMPILYTTIDGTRVWSDSLQTRMKDYARRPVIAFADSTEAGVLKGSARSVAGVHIRDVLDAVAADIQT